MQCELRQTLLALSVIMFTLISFRVSLLRKDKHRNQSCVHITKTFEGAKPALVFTTRDGITGYFVDTETK